VRDPVTDEHGAEKVCHDDRYVDKVQMHSDASFYCYGVLLLACQQKRRRRLPKDGKAGEVSHIRLNSDNDPAHRARLYDLARGDHFARLLDDVQTGTSDLK
jgi:hypothetical protein